MTEVPIIDKLFHWCALQINELFFYIIRTFAMKEFIKRPQLIKKNFEYISHIMLVFPLLTLNKCQLANYNFVE